MKRVIESLNEMSFDLPEGFTISADKYKLFNGQGFINKENYISPEGKVLSFFEIQRDPNEFYEHFHNLVENYNEKRDALKLIKQFSITANDFNFPIYIIKGVKNSTFIVHVFINCGDGLGCFIFNIEHFEEDKRALISKNKLFAQVAQILRTIE